MGNFISDFFQSFDRERDTSKTTEIDPEVQQFRNKLYGLASNQFDQPFQKYTGRRFAPWTDDMNQYMEGSGAWE